eukprot:g36958.t1
MGTRSRDVAKSTAAQMKETDDIELSFEDLFDEPPFHSPKKLHHFRHTLSPCRPSSKSISNGFTPVLSPCDKHTFTHYVRFTPDDKAALTDMDDNPAFNDDDGSTDSSPRSFQASHISPSNADDDFWDLGHRHVRKKTPPSMTDVVDFLKSVEGKPEPSPGTKASPAFDRYRNPHIHSLASLCAEDDLRL